MTQTELARLTGKPEQTVRNLLSRDSMRYSTVEMFLDALGFDIVFRDRKTGELYEE